MPVNKANTEIIMFSRKISLLNCPLLAPIIFRTANCLLLFFKKFPTDYKVSINENSMDTMLAMSNISPIALALSTISSAGCIANVENSKKIKTENTQLKKWYR